jgi:hypothetical protein
LPGGGPRAAQAPVWARATCAGKTCGCVLEYEPNNSSGNEAIARLTDGTLRKIYDSNMDVTLNDIYQPVVSSARVRCIAATAPSSIAISGYGAPVGCAVVTDGSVWCFPPQGYARRFDVHR